MSGQTDPRSRHRLRIRLDGSRRTQGYVPGSTIRGTVSLEVGADADSAGSRARLLLSLCGRSNCTITKHGNSDAVPATKHHSVFHLFDSDATTEVILDGPLQIGPDGRATWPFSMAIPLMADGAVLAASDHREASYTPIDGMDQPLPGSFAFACKDAGESLEADVTYSLHASLTVPTSPEGLGSATLPLFVHPPPHLPPLDDFQLQTRRDDDDDDGHTFRSYSLLPTGEDVKRPGMLRRVFSPNSAPLLGVRYEVDAPSVIQLDNPAPLPLRMRALPDLERTSRDVDGVKQSICVEEVCLSVEAETGGRAGEGVGGVESSGGWGRLDHRVERFEGRRRDVYLELLAFGDPTLDLGRIMGVRFHSGVGGLAPAFTALNISHENHRLSWCISVSFAGQAHKIRGSQPVTILPPACNAPPTSRPASPDEARPPPYDFDQPPEYSP